jgi:hypothetical protein
MNQYDRLNDELLLVLRCQEGDTEAFEQLVGRWQKRLWRHARRLVDDDSAAWDAVQETWIGISQGIGRLADAAAFPAWAYQVVSNKCRDSARRARRCRSVLLRSGLPLTLTPWAPNHCFNVSSHSVKSGMNAGFGRISGRFDCANEAACSRFQLCSRIRYAMLTRPLRLTPLAQWI